MGTNHRICPDQVPIEEDSGKTFPIRDPNGAKGDGHMSTE
jgi:hypothetical protein